MFLLREQVIALLAALGVPDAWSDPLLDCILQNVSTGILNDINQSSIPEGLESVAVYRATGQYLQFKKGIGRLEGFDLEPAVKQIQEGDSTVTFALGDGSVTPEQRLDGLIAHLCSSGNSQLSTYRRLRW